MRGFGMKRLTVFMFLLLFVLVQLSDAVLTKTHADVDEWAEIAQNAVREGTTVNISGCYYTTLHIDMALTSAVAHTGTKIRIQVSSNTTGDEDWTTYKIITGPTGASGSNPEALAGAEAAGQTQIEVADTTGYEADEVRWIFLEDNTVADSEMLMLVSHDGTPSITILDGLTNAHDASDTLHNIAQNYAMHIPPVFLRVRIIYDNTFDSNGATVHTRARVSKVTEM